MLESITVRNYKSIIDTTLSLSYGSKRAPGNHGERDTLSFLEDGGRRVVPLLVIYGANSSGKSTIISALRTLCCLLDDGADAVPYTPNRLTEDPGETFFSITAVISSKEYIYSISYRKGEITYEALTCEGKPVFTRTKGILSVPEGEKTVSVKHALLSPESTDNEVQKAASFIRNKLIFFSPFRYSPLESFGKYCSLSGLKRKECLEEVSEFFRKLDLSIDDIREDDGWLTEHTDSRRKNVWFTLEEESEGTRRLFALVSMIFAALSSGSVLIIDEMDVSLHSVVLRVLVYLFISKEYNEKGAQLIASMHNTDILDAPYIRPDEIAIFEKTQRMGSVIERLCDKGVTGSRSLRRRYLEGSFSGIPFPYI